MLGSPIAHSLSPLLHNAGYAALGLSDWRYTLADLAEEDLAEFVDGLDESWRGLSLTMPLKEAAFDVASTVSEIARQAGSINTLVRRPDGSWEGHNTDVAGIVAALRHLDLGEEAVVIGAGATARSAVLAVRDLGIRSVTVAARRVEPARRLAALAEEHGLAARVVELAEWAGTGSRLVLSTVPVGASDALVDAARRSGAGLDVILFDVVYADWPTPLAATVTRAGGQAVSGLEMLVHQAALQFELFTGHAVDPAVLRAAVIDHR